ncbi:MAG: hypothetical protein RLZ55_130 [Actinomycetota bacterium]
MTPEPPPGRWRDEPVRLVEYDPAWPAAFEAEASAIRAAMGEQITGDVLHVGSTAIPGMTAKPIIDVMVGVEDLEAARSCIPRLAPLDYCYAPYRPDVMAWFCKPDPAHRTHHLHLVPTGSRRYNDELAFRDYLRAHPATASAYADLKRDLAVRFRDDREAYTEGKSDFVARVLAAAARP